MGELDFTRVVVHESFEDRQFDVRVSNFLNVRSIVIALVRKLGLSEEEYCFSLWHRDRTRSLTMYENMVAARVREGDMLELYAVPRNRAPATSKIIDTLVGPPGQPAGDDGVSILSNEAVASPTTANEPVLTPIPSRMASWLPLGMSVKTFLRRGSSVRVVCSDRAGFRFLVVV